MTTKDKDTVSLGSTARESSDGSAPVAATGFTPGPWWVHKRLKHYYIRSVDGTYVMESHSYGVRTEADARLIAAAPELYAMVGHLVWLVETQLRADGAHITADAKALLAKVEGR